MDQDKAGAALAALAQDTRLSVFRLLVKAGPDGMIAGALAQAMDVPPSTMSHHLASIVAIHYCLIVGVYMDGT